MKALVVTVGVGTGVSHDKEGDVKGLVHGIVESVRNCNPGHVSFVVSRESLEVTVPEIKKQFPGLEKTLTSHCLIQDVNDVNEVYRVVLKEVRGLSS